MKYIATKPGYYNGDRIAAGDAVEAPEGIKSKWLVPADQYKAPAPKGLRPQPSTFSEIARMPPPPPPTTSRGRKPKEEAKGDRASDKNVLGS